MICLATDSISKTFYDDDAKKNHKLVWILPVKPWEVNRLRPNVSNLIKRANVACSCTDVLIFIPTELKSHYGSMRANMIDPYG